ncbi:MAG: PAS domain S-box protein, partial [bacterium]
IGLSFIKSKDDMLIVSYITDMTNCKHAEAPSQVSAGKYLNLFEQSKDPISITTRDGKIIDVNKAFLDLFGYTKEEINRLNAKELYHNPESRKRFQEEIEKQGSVKDFEVELCKKDGQKLIVLLTSTVRRDSEANILGYQGILRDITERKRAEEALRESEARNLAIVNTAADGIITTDDHGRIESFNPAAEKMFGYATNEVIGQNVNILMASPYCEEHDSYLKNYLESGEKKVIGIAGREVVAKRKDGTSFPVLLAVSEMSFSNKRMFTGIVRDITERKRAEEVLRNIAEGVSAATGKAFFRSLVQYLATNLNMDYAFIGEIAGEKGDSVNTLAVYAHGEIVENFQYYLKHTPCENVIAKRLSTYTHSVQQQFLQDDLLKELGIESYIGTPLFDSEGYPLGVMAVLDSQALSNTTLTESMLRIFAVRASAELERKRVEEALLESEKRYKRLLASVTDYLYTVKVENGQEVETSHGPGCEALTGYTPQEYAANPDLWYQMVHKDDRAAVANQARKVLSEKDVQPIEHRIIHKNGSIRWVKNTPVPRLDNHGNLVAYDGLVSDITERRFLQEELARAQRLETAGRVAGQIAHDFNNLLSPLTAYPTLIKEELPLQHHVFDMLDEMEDSAQKIAEINQQLLALGRRGHYTMEPVDLNDLVHKVVMSISLPEEIVIQEKLASDLFLIKGGTAQLTRAFINLISNAKEAMHGKGSLTVSTENSYLEKPLKGYHAVRRGEYVKLQISDTGTGIKAELLDKIFDPFFTTKKMDRIRGSGLGLSVVHGIIEDHQGYILVDSKRKKGTTFSLFFPVTRDIEKELAQAIEKSKGGNERILVVDDDPVQRKVA